MRNNRYNSRVSTNLTTDEKNRLEILCDKLGVKVADFIRNLILIELGR